MPDYTAFESILSQAIPQVYASKYPAGEWKRSIRIDKEDAEDNFRVTSKHIFIHPRLFDEDLDVFKLCTRIAKAAWDFDHLQERRQLRLWEEFAERLERDIEEIRKRWGDEGLEDLLMRALPETYRVESAPEREWGGIL